MVSLAAEYTMHALDHPEKSRLALTHRRADVQALNRLIRTGLREAGPLAEAETVIETAAGARSFAIGDRIVFLENDSRLGVRNGSLGTVEALGDGQMRVRLGGRDDPIEIDTTRFRAFDHGYATTIHKAQGATVDRAFVFAGPTMDRHLTYVAMTRHREEVTLNAAKETFRDFGGLVGKLSRSGLRPNALDYEGFLARRGLAGMLVRIGRGLMRGLVAALDRSAIPELADTFLKFSGDERASPPETVLINEATEELRERIAAMERERARQEREWKLSAEQQLKQQELEKPRSRDRGFGGRDLSAMGDRDQFSEDGDSSPEDVVRAFEQTTAAIKGQHEDISVRFQKLNEHLTKATGTSGALVRSENAGELARLGKSVEDHVQELAGIGFLSCLILELHRAFTPAEIDALMDPDKPLPASMPALSAERRQEIARFLLERARNLAPSRSISWASRVRGRVPGYGMGFSI